LTFHRKFQILFDFHFSGKSSAAMTGASYGQERQPRFRENEEPGERVHVLHV
jgi:hypothetical protein